MSRFIFCFLFVLCFFSCSFQKSFEFKGISMEKWNEAMMDKALLQHDSLCTTNEFSHAQQLAEIDTLLLISKANKLKIAEQNLYRRYAFLYSEMGALNEATEYLNKSILISAQLNDTFAYWSNKANLGLIYFRFKLYDKALENLNPSIQYFKIKNHTYSYSHWMYILSQLYIDINEKIKAEQSAKEAIVFKLKIKQEFSFLKNDSLMFAMHWLTILNEINADSALSVLNNTEPWIIREKDSVLKSYAYGLSSLVKYPNLKSKNYLDSSIHYFPSNASSNDKLSQYELLSKYYLKNNQKDSAIKYSLLKQNFKDTFYSIEKLKILSNSERVYSMMLNKDLQLLNKEKKIQSLLLYLLFGFIVLFASLVYVFYIKNKRKKDKILEERNSKINKLIEEVNHTKMEAWAEGQEKERTRIAAELHDRLGGLLVMAGQHFNQFEKRFEQLKKENLESFSDFKKIINSAIIEVRELSKDISSNLVSKLGLPHALLDLKNKVESATSIKINLEVFNADSRLKLSNEIALFRVAQESLNNAIKHANATNISMSLTGNDDSVILMIEDNGKGFDVKTIETISGLGINSMKKRIHDIGGVITIDSKMGRGTIIIVELNAIKE